MWINFKGYSKQNIMKDVEAALRLGADQVIVSRSESDKSYPYGVDIFFAQEGEKE